MAASPGYGFDGIAVALLGVLLGAALFGGLSYGSAGMSFGAGVPSQRIARRPRRRHDNTDNDEQLCA